MSSAKLRVGTTVGGCWRLDELLGVGSTAAVYSATHTSGRRAAFKVLDRALALDLDARELFQRKHAVTRQLEHPACVRVEGSSRTDDGIPMLVMELLEGETLEARWRREGPMPVVDAFSIAERLLEFLHRCHALGIVHCDLRPSNVFLTAGGGVKVLHFAGPRAPKRRSMATDPAPGAASYRAPELAHARPEHVDGRADLFAVGAILYTLVTGRSPRRGRSAEHRLDAHEAAPSVVIVAPGLPAAATSVVDRAMQWRPSARYPDAGAMRFAVLAVCRTLVRTSCLAADPPFEQVFAIDERPTLPETPRAQRAP